MKLVDMEEEGGFIPRRTLKKDKFKEEKRKWVEPNVKARVEAVQARVIKRANNV